MAKFYSVLGRESPYQGTGPSLWKVLSSFSNKNLLDYTLILFKQSKMDVTLHWDTDPKIINYGWLQESKLTE